MLQRLWPTRCGRADHLLSPRTCLLALLLNVMVMILQAMPPAAAQAQPQVSSAILDMKEYHPDPSHNHGPPGTVYHNGTYWYIPAPPGTRPACARAGDTFCTDVPAYPGEIMRNLLKSWMFDLSTVFVSETDAKLTRPGPRPQSSARRPPANRETKIRFPTNRRRASVFNHQSASRNATASRRRPISRWSSTLATNRKRARSTSTNQRRVGSIESRGYTHLPPHRPATRGYSAFAAHRKRRQAGDDTASKLCPTSGQFITPMVGLNIRGQWRFLVNDPSQNGKFTQLVRTERCLTDECGGLCTVPAGVSARCQQQFVQKKLICLDPSGTKMYTDLFWLPSCCVCEIG